MGHGQSKNSPDEQMRMKMENGVDEDDDDDIEALGLSERENKNPRSKSNLSFHTSERFQNADGDEYFNNIYNKKTDKSRISLNSAGGSFGAKSAPPGPKKDNDPEVAAAIAELEETFKVLGDSTLPNGGGTAGGVMPQISQNQTLENDVSESLSLEDDVSSSPSHTDSTRELCDSAESGVETQSESSPCQLQYDRHLITRAGDSNNVPVIDQNGFPRGANKFLELNSSRGIGTSGGYSNITHSSSGSSSQGSRGLEQRGFLTSSQSNIRTGRNSSNIMSQSILMQQRKDFQRKLAADVNLRNVSGISNGESALVHQEDWTYEPPKIDGFDIEKFKEINSKVPGTTIVPIIMRDDEDNGYCSRSPEMPAYTKDELKLIASLEREVY